MFRSNLATYPYVNPINTYGENLGRAARGFLAALFAVDPAEAHEDTPGMAARNDADAIDELNELASQFDDLMPNQAAELRYLAGTADTAQDDLQ